MTSSRRLDTSLLLAQMAAVATIVRSVLFDRWITVFASLLMIVGLQAAIRRKTWGVGLALGAAAAFPAAHLLGMAPAWFWLVGIVGSAPFVIATPWMARFDKGATALFAVMAVSAGIAGATAYHEIAPRMYAAHLARAAQHTHHAYRSCH